MDWNAPLNAEYHLGQYLEPYRSTVALAAFALPYLTGGRALDAGCGAGANIQHLRGLLPLEEWVGVDIAPRFLEQAREHVDGEFVEGDLFNLCDTFPAGSFDVVFSIQTVSWLESYEAALEQMLLMLRPGGMLFVTSLFTDSLVDAQIVVKPTDPDSFGEAFYNVYCLDRFVQECERHNAELVAAQDFVIDVDLDPPAHRGMGTRTRRLEDGTRLQFSGPLWMPWKMLALRARG